MYTHAGRFLKAPLKIIGGKQKSRDIIYVAAPPGYTSFVEPFLGSGAVAIGLSETVLKFCNDLNEDIIHFYKQLQESPGELFGQIMRNVERLRAEEKAYFYELRDLSHRNLPDIERAAWLYTINKSCFNGIIRYAASGKCNSSYCGTAEGRGWLSKEWVRRLSIVLRSMSFCSMDFRTFMQPFTGMRGAWIFLDPPYFLKGAEDPAGTVTIYNGKKFTTEDHFDLAEILHNTRANWSMTINDCSWVRKTYNQFNILDNPINYSCSQTVAGRGWKNELLITNYDVPKHEPRIQKVAGLLV